MTDWEKELSDKLSKYSEEEFNYIDTKDITKASEIDYGCSGVYMEATIIYFEIKNLHYIYLDYGLDSEKLFHCGASSKDAGGKVTTIMQVECPEVYHPLIETLGKVNLSRSRVRE